MANTQRRVPVRLEGNCAGMLDMLYQVAQQPRAYWHLSLVSFCLGVATSGTQGVADAEFAYAAVAVAVVDKVPPVVIPWWRLSGNVACSRWSGCHGRAKAARAHAKISLGAQCPLSSSAHRRSCSCVGRATV